MVTEEPVDLNLTMSPSSHKIPALLTKNSAQPCQIESCGEIMWILVRLIDDDDHNHNHNRNHNHQHHATCIFVQRATLSCSESTHSENGGGVH